jgi:membrane-bound metal-dependent hydrolase YbcI (DUF457 family)
VDPVTHTLAGVTVAYALYRDRAGPSSVPILAIASNLPDLDALVVLSGDPRALLLRRTFGHSILLLPVWIAAAAWILRRFFPGPGRWRVGEMVAVGSGLHLVFDLINSFGVVLLWPFSDWRPELAWVFIVDFALTGILLVPLAAAILPALKARTAAAARLAVVLAAAYLLVCAASRDRAGDLLGSVTRGDGGPVEFSYVFPEPLGPHRWRGVIRSGRTYRAYLIHPWSGGVGPGFVETTDPDDPAVRAARRSDLGRRLERFFKAPVWRRDPAPRATGDPVRVTAHDLRFRPLLLDRPAVFSFCIEVPASGDPRPCPRADSIRSAVVSSPAL